MAYKEYTSFDSFYWATNLSDERKQQILDWVAAMSDDEAGLLSDLIWDVREQQDYDKPIGN